MVTDTCWILFSIVFTMWLNLIGQLQKGAKKFGLSSETYQNRRDFSCNGKNICTRNNVGANIFHCCLDVIHHIQTSYGVVVWEGLLLTHYRCSVVQQNRCITTLQATTTTNIYLSSFLKLSSVWWLFQHEKVTYLNKTVVKEKPDETCRHTRIPSWHFLYHFEHNITHGWTSPAVEEGV